MLAHAPQVRDILKGGANRARQSKLLSIHVTGPAAAKGKIKKISLKAKISTHSKEPKSNGRH